jgi:predicted nucleic acid-binding protein
MSANLGLQFVDTNILVYAHDRSARSKHERSLGLIEELWENHLGCLSIQVMQEFYVVTTQKINKPLDRETATRILRNLTQWHIHAPIADDVLGAIGLQQQYELSFWDAMVLWSAQQLGCSTLWSEDLSEGQEYGDLRVLNPFTVGQEQA